MNSRKPLRLAFVLLFTIIAIAFYQNSKSLNKSAWSNSGEKIRKLSSKETTLSDSDKAKKKVQIRVEEFNDEVNKMLKRYKRLTSRLEDQEDDKLSMKEIKAMEEDFKDYFPKDRIKSLTKERESLAELLEAMDLTKEDDKKLFKLSDALDDIDRSELLAEIKSTKNDLLEKKNKKLQKELKAESCDSYNVLSDLYDIIGKKLEDKRGIVGALENEMYSDNYMGFYFQQMMSRQMMVNPMAQMFGMQSFTGSFQHDLSMVQARSNFGFTAPSIFDHSNMFSLPTFGFPNVSSDRLYTQRQNAPAAASTVNNYYYNSNNTFGDDANVFRSPSQHGAWQNQVDFGNNYLDQGIPSYSRGNADVSIFSQEPQSQI